MIAIPPFVDGAPLGMRCRASRAARTDSCALRVVAALLLGACAAPTTTRSTDSATVISGPVTSAPADWRRGATCYEVFVRSFYDSNGDGIGDLRGLTQKLDYISDLGARC